MVCCVVGRVRVFVHARAHTHALTHTHAHTHTHTHVISFLQVMQQVEFDHGGLGVSLQPPPQPESGDCGREGQGEDNALRAALNKFKPLGGI